MSNKFAEQIVEFLVGRFKEEAKAAGHSLSGKLMKSIEGEIVRTIDGMMITFYAEEYGIVLSEGVAPERIPFGGTSKRVPGSKSTKRSKYIQGLQKYAQKRFGLGRKKALSAAFAIAKKQKKFGMPISTKGKGTKWIDKAIKGTNDEVQRIVDQWVKSQVEIIFSDVLKAA